MKTNLKLILFIIMQLMILIGISHVYIASSNEALLTPKQMQADLDQLKYDFEKRHPLSITKMPKEYELLFHKANTQLTQPLSLEAYSVILSKTLAQIGDDHTQIEFILESPVLPIVFKIINNKFYVLDGGNVVPNGSEILRIANIPMHEIYESYCELYSAENDYWRQVQFEQRYIEVQKIKELNGRFNLFGGVDIFYLAPSLDGNTQVQSKTVTKNDYIKEQYTFYNPIYTLYNDKYEGQCDENIYKYFVDEGKDYLYFVADWCHFYEGYERILLEVFTVIDDKHIQNIVVDLRGNPGGSSEIIDPFFEKVKSHNFHLKNDSNEETSNLHVYGLTDKRTYSSAVQFAVEIQNYEYGSLIGQPTGGTLPSFGNSPILELENTGLLYSISEKFIRYQGRDRNEFDTLMPDILSNYAIEDFLNGNDKDLLIVENLISR